MNKEKLKKSLGKGILAFFITFGMIGVLNDYVRLIKGYSGSLPETYFLQLPKVTPKKGDLTMTHHDFCGVRIIKLMIGTAGDKIWQDAEENIWVNDEKIGKADGKLSTGQVLTSSVSRVIPEGKVFLYTPHPKSLDSRYEEIGLIPISKLEGKVIALF